MKDTKSLVTGHKATGNCAKGHASVAFTMNQYQHILPGMQAEAASVFASLVRADQRPVTDLPTPDERSPH